MLKKFLFPPARANKAQPENEDSNTQNSWIAAINHSRHMTYMLWIVVIANLFLVFRVVNQDVISTTVPPNFSEEIKFIGKQAGSTYKKQWGIFVADLLGNVNVRNKEIVLDTLKPMLSPRDYEGLDAQITAHVNALDIRDQIQNFDAIDIYYDRKFDKVIVYGEREIIDRKKVTRAENRRPIRWTYELELGSRNGQPRMKSVNQYEGAPKIERNRMEREK